MTRSGWAGVELKAAVEDWQMKRNVPEPRLTTGFLEGTHPVVDVYELKVSRHLINMSLQKNCAWSMDFAQYVSHVSTFLVMNVAFIAA